MFAEVASNRQALWDLCASLSAVHDLIREVLTPLAALSGATVETISSKLADTRRDMAGGLRLIEDRFGRLDQQLSDQASALGLLIAELQRLQRSRTEVPCRYFALGTCVRESCPYKHDASLVISTEDKGKGQSKKCKPMKPPMPEC